MKAQFVEDALRLATPNAIITPRVAGFGVSYNGLIDDIGALVYNPAGLVNIARSEVSFGLGITRNKSDVEFLDNTKEFRSNNGFISNFGIVAPIKESTKGAAVGIGYFLENNYDNDMKYAGFNTRSTYIADEASIGGADGRYDNWAEYLGLANKNFKTPLQDSLTQTGFVQESGGLHNIVGGAAFNLGDHFSLGVSVTGKFGSYGYARSYEEWDSENIYTAYDSTYSNLDFNRLNVDENVSQDITGITGAIGIQASFGKHMRFGINIKLPTFYEINEVFSQRFDATFDNGDYSYKTFDGKNSYSVTTPFVYSAGFSFHHWGFVFTAGAEYVDITQLEFSGNLNEFNMLNQQIVKELVGQIAWGFGAEYDIPGLPVVVRSSYSRTSSPYSNDLYDYNLTNLAFGAGVYFGQKIRIDGVARFSGVSMVRTNYGSPDYPATYSSYLLTKRPMSIAVGITYRY